MPLFVASACRCADRAWPARLARAQNKRDLIFAELILVFTDTLDQIKEEYLALSHHGARLETVWLLTCVRNVEIRSSDCVAIGGRSL